MAALTADKARTVYGTPIGVDVRVAASTTLYAGAIAVGDAGGDAVAATDAAGLALLGIVTEKVDNSSGADGDKTVVVQRGHIEKLNHSALVQADVGKNVFVSDDNTVSDSAAMTNDLKVGTLVGFEDGDALVLIGVFADVDA